MLKLGMVTSPSAGVWVIAQSSENPAQFFTQLGIASAVCFVFYLWLRDVIKQRDRAVTSLETIQPILTEILHAIQRSNDALQASAEATKAVSGAIQGLPEPKVWYNLEQVVGRMGRVVDALEAQQRREPGG